MFGIQISPVEWKRLLSYIRLNLLQLVLGLISERKTDIIQYTRNNTVTTNIQCFSWTEILTKTQMYMCRTLTK